MQEFQKFLLKRALRLARMRTERVTSDKWNAIFAAEAVLEDPFATDMDAEVAVHRLLKEEEPLKTGEAT